MKKRMLSVVLVLAMMAVWVPVGAWAKTATDTDFGLIFNTADGKFYLDSNNTWTNEGNPEYNTGKGDTWNWDGSTNTLTLNNFEWITTAETALRILGGGSLIIDLTGENRFETLNPNPHCGISADLDLTFSGDGLLYADSGMSTFGTGLSAGVRSITINGPTINAQGGLFGVVCRGLALNSGVLNAESNRYGIMANNALDSPDIISPEPWVDPNEGLADPIVTITCGTLTAQGGSIATSDILIAPWKAYTYWTSTDSTTDPGGPGTVFNGGNPFINIDGRVTDEFYKFVKIIVSNDAEAPSPYSDVSSADWFYDAVRYVTESGLMNGTATGKFSPNVTMTRAMLVTVLWRLEGEPSMEIPYQDTMPPIDYPWNLGVLSFPDVPNHEWYSKAVWWARLHGIVSGYSNGAFGLNDPVTREQAVVILYRYAKMKGLDVSASADLSKFADANDISGWALDAMKWAVAEGIIEGRPGNKAAPKDTSTRAEVATVFMRYIKDFLD